jgi:predicted PurR-regulated permease PerM
MHFSISTGTIIRFFGILVVLALLYYMSDVLLVILAAVVLASAMEPIVRRLKRYRLHRVVAVVLIYLGIAAVIAGIVVFFLPMVVNDTVSFLDAVPKTISLDSLWNPAGEVALQGSSVSSHLFSLSDLAKGLQNFLVGTSDSAVQTVSVIFGGMLSLILILVLSFYLAAQEEGVDDFLRIITPVRHYDYIIDLWKRSQRKIGLWLQGQVLLGIIIGLLVYLVLMVVGIPHALLLAVLAALLEIIPVFGPIVSAVPAILVAFTDRGTGVGFLIVGLYLIIHQFENHLFYPLVVKKIVGISPIVVIIALVIGAKLAGVLGALIAVPLSAAFMEYIHDIEKYKKLERAERAVAKEGGL